MTIAVDLGRKATKQTNKINREIALFRHKKSKGQLNLLSSKADLYLLLYIIYLQKQVCHDAADFK